MRQCAFCAEKIELELTNIPAIKVSLSTSTDDLALRADCVSIQGISNLHRAISLY